MFTLMLQNGLLVLVAPHFQNQEKKCRNRSWIQIWSVFTRLPERKMTRIDTYYKVHPQNPFGRFLNLNKI